MANAANQTSVGASIRPPEYRKAVQLMRHDIKKKKDRISGINGEINDVWGKIEGYKVPKDAARIFMKLDALEQDERTEIMRALNGLCDVAQWPEHADPDLADQAENKVVHLRVGGNQPSDSVGDDDVGGLADGYGDGEEEEEEEAGEDDDDSPTLGQDGAVEPPKRGRKPKGITEALDASRGHLGSQAQPRDEAPGDNVLS